MSRPAMQGYQQNPNMKIFEIFFRQSFLHDGGMFLEVKFLKKAEPQSGFRPELDFQNSPFSWELVKCATVHPTMTFLLIKEVFKYYKMMIFENPVWMENDFRNPIFWIFYFQKHPPIWGMWRVKFFFQNFKV